MPVLTSYLVDAIAAMFMCVCVCLCSEWSVANIDSLLAVSMSKNVAKTVVFFCTKSEQLVSLHIISSLDSHSPTGPTTVRIGLIFFEPGRYAKPVTFCVYFVLWYFLVYCCTSRLLC